MVSQSIRVATSMSVKFPGRLGLRFTRGNRTQPTCAPCRSSKRSNEDLSAKPPWAGEDHRLIPCNFAAAEMRNLAIVAQGANHPPYYDSCLSGIDLPQASAPLHFLPPQPPPPKPAARHLTTATQPLPHP